MPPLSILNTVGELRTMTHFAGEKASPPATSPLVGGFTAWEETGDVTGLLAAADWLDEEGEGERAAWLRQFAADGPEDDRRVERIESAFDSDVRFFYDHCGYCGDGRYSWQEARARAAVELARAERWAGDNAEHGWEGDPEGTRDDNAPRWRCVMWVTAENEGKGPIDSTSLSGIDFGNDGPDGPYKRLVEAELAMELMPYGE